MEGKIFIAIFCVGVTLETVATFFRDSFCEFAFILSVLL